MFIAWGKLVIANPIPRVKKGKHMLGFCVNGKNIELLPICDKGSIGQMVILGSRVDWGNNPDPVEKPLSKYPYLSIFTIVVKELGEDGYYILSDAKGERVKIYLVGTDHWYLYDAQEWLNFNHLRETEKFARKERKISQLEGHVDLLKDILVKQGIRIVTEGQAKKLGID